MEKVVDEVGENPIKIGNPKILLERRPGFRSGTGVALDALVKRFFGAGFEFSFAEHHQGD